MNRWKYDGEWCKTVPVNWDSFYIEAAPPHSVIRVFHGSTEFMIYHKRWDKCFWLNTVGNHGNGNQLKASVEDIYSHRNHWVNAKDCELVVKDL